LQCDLHGARVTIATNIRN